MLAGVGYDSVWTAGETLEDDTDPRALVRASLSTRYFAGVAATHQDEVEELQAVIASGTVGIWAGRRELGFGVAHGGGIATNAFRLDGGGVFLARPLSIAVLKNIRFEMHLSKVDNVLNLNQVERQTEPWYWTGRGSFELHPRLRIGVNRGMMFGGEGNLPVTASRVLKNLVGIYTSNDENSFANQLISVDFRYRVPSGAVPVTLYLDWGSEDASGGWWEVPAIIAGIEASLLPHRDLAFGVERTEFTPTTEGNGIWYQNAWFRGGWADAGQLLGHPLGGHGTEWRAFVGGGSPRHGFSFDVAAYTRRRRSENLFAPTRAGSSVGGVVNLDARLNSTFRIVLDAEVEQGSGDADWTASTARAGIRYVF